VREGKRQLLEEEYQNYQIYLKGDKDIKLYSATKQQADKFLMRLRRQNGGLLDTTRDYPLILRNKIRNEDTKLTHY